MRFHNEKRILVIDRHASAPEGMICRGRFGVNIMNSEVDEMYQIGKEDRKLVGNRIDRKSVV